MLFNKKILVLVLVVLFSLSGASVYAQNFSGYEPKGFFNNFAGNEDWGIEQKLRNYEQETTAEIVVVLISNAENLADFSYQLFNVWGIGKDISNGFLILVLTETKQLILLSGSGFLVCDEEIKEVANGSLDLFKDRRIGNGLHEISDRLYVKVRLGQRGQRSPNAHGFFGGGQTGRQPIILSY